MANKLIEVGQKVRCQWRNGVEKVFYGEPWEGEVVAIDLSTSKPVCVRHEVIGEIWVHAIEVKEILEEAR